MSYVVAPSVTIFAELLDTGSILLELVGFSLLEETGVLLLDEEIATLLLETTGASPISGHL